MQDFSIKRDDSNSEARWRESHGLGRLRCLSFLLPSRWIMMIYSERFTVQPKVKYL